MECFTKTMLELMFDRDLITLLKKMLAGFLPDCCAKFCFVSVLCAKTNKRVDMTEQKIVEYFVQNDSSNSAFAVRARKLGNTPSGLEVFLWSICEDKTKYPTGIYLVKVGNVNTRTRYEICSKLTIKTPEQRQC